MASDTFWQELFHLPPTQFVDAAQRYLLEAFTADTRPEAVQKLIEAAWFTVHPEPAEEVARLIPLPQFIEETPDPPPPIVSDVVPANKLVLISGRPKDGKSMVIYQLLEDINRGGKLMGRFPVARSGPVCYFGMEDGAGEIKDRLVKKGLIDPEDFYICPIAFDIHNAAGWATFTRLIAALPTPPIVVVIDTIKEALVSIRDWNDQALMGPALKKLRQWAHDNATVILLAHNNKDKSAEGVNRVSGTAALVSSCDVVGILERVDPRDYGLYSWVYELTGRGIKADKYLIDMDTDTWEVTCLNETEEAREAREVRRASRHHQKALLLQAATQGVPFTVNQMAEVLSITYAYAANIVAELYREQRLNKGRKVQEGSRRHLSQTYVLV